MRRSWNGYWSQKRPRIAGSSITLRLVCSLTVRRYVTAIVSPLILSHGERLVNMRRSQGGTSVLKGSVATVHQTLGGWGRSMTTLARKLLYDLVWTTPLKVLAAKFSISDVGLRKICVKANIPTPERGYALLDQLRIAVGGERSLGNLGNSRNWPRRGVYFFFEPGEQRSDSGQGPRLVRIGTHALSAGAKSTLHQRLRQHAGQFNGGGNHRGSIFRLLVGEALLARNECVTCNSWGVKGDAGKAAEALGKTRSDLAALELPVELKVSLYLKAMPFLWLPIEDESGPDSRRGFIERNSIALLSNLDRTPVDPPTGGWLGHRSGREKVRRSGLWNQRHVDESHNPSFLSVLEELISGAMGRSTG